MIDTELRAAFSELTLLFEQMIQLQGNFQHHATVKPQLEKLRKQLADGVAIAANPELALAQKAVEDAKAKLAALTSGAAPGAAAALAVQYGVAGHPGCAGCKRSPEELIGGGHGPGCSSLAGASP